MVGEVMVEEGREKEGLWRRGVCEGMNGELCGVVRGGEVREPLGRGSNELGGTGVDPAEREALAWLESSPGVGRTLTADGWSGLVWGPG